MTANPGPNIASNASRIAITAGSIAGRIYRVKIVSAPRASSNERVAAHAIVNSQRNGRPQPPIVTVCKGKTNGTRMMKNRTHLSHEAEKFVSTAMHLIRGRHSIKKKDMSKAHAGVISILVGKT